MLLVNTEMLDVFSAIVTLLLIVVLLAGMSALAIRAFGYDSGELSVQGPGWMGNLK